MSNKHLMAKMCHPNRWTRALWTGGQGWSLDKVVQKTAVQIVGPDVGGDPIFMSFGVQVSQKCQKNNMTFVILAICWFQNMLFFKKKFIIDEKFGFKEKLVPKLSLGG